MNFGGAGRQSSGETPPTHLCGVVTVPSSPFLPACPGPGRTAMAAGVFPAAATLTSPRIAGLSRGTRPLWSQLKAGAGTGSWLPAPARRKQRRPELLPAHKPNTPVGKHRSFGQTRNGGGAPLRHDQKACFGQWVLSSELVSIKNLRSRFLAS